MITIDLPLSDKFSVLAAIFPADYRKALRSFYVLHDVGPLDIAYDYVVRNIAHIICSNSQPLHLGEQPTTFISTLTLPAEAMCTYTLEALGRETRCSDSAEERTPSTVDFAV